MTSREKLGTVIFGDVVGSRTRPQSGRWLERLRKELDDEYRGQKLARFEFTQGDELQGLLAPAADPFRCFLRPALLPRTVAPEMRWAIVAGHIESGRGPATRRTGQAFLDARATLELARRSGDNLLVKTGHQQTDALLDGTAPVLATLLVRLTDRQREIARLALLNGLKQSEIATELSVRRATVSIAWRRADVRGLARLLSAIRTLWAAGIAQGGGHS